MKRQAIIHGDAIPHLPPLPPGWCWVRLSDLHAPEANSITDGPFGSKLKTEHYTESGPRVIRLQNIGDGIFHDEQAHISEDHFNSLRKHQVFPGDLVIGALGVELPRSCLIPEWLGPAIVKADCIRFKPHSTTVSSAYLNFALISDGTRRRTNTIIHGVGRPRLNLSEIKSIQVPLAPLNEQRRIVTKIEELFSDLDAGVAALERIRAKLKRYRAAVLKAAVEGKLTADWRAKHADVEPATELLKRILAERRCKWEADQLAKFANAGKEPPKGWREKYQEPAGPNVSALPTLLEGWRWATIEQLLSEGSCNGVSVKGTDTPPGIPALRLGAMSDRGFDYTIRRFIPISEETADSLAIREGEFFVARGNGSLHLVGRGSLAQQPPERIVFPDTMIRLRLVDFSPLRQFLALIWQTRWIRSQVEKKARTTAGIYKISQRDIDGFTVPVPPLAEQDALIAIISSHLSIIEAVEKQAEANLRRARRLRQSILKRAFEGKLVPQDDTDEPASVLLERIRQQRSQPICRTATCLESERQTRDNAKGRRKPRAKRISRHVNPGNGGRRDEHDSPQDHLDQ